jgi:hypothetical protein
MRIAKSILVCVCLLGLAQPVWSQKPNETAKPTPGILGYLDPKTGAFRPLVQNPVEDEEVEPALAPTTGTFVFNFTITIASKNLGGDTILCTVDTSTFDAAALLTASESASVKATVTGSTAKCTVTIPYSWPLKSATTDTVSLDYSVSAVASTTTSAEPVRISGQNLPTIKVPKTGATTTQTIASTI